MNNVYKLINKFEILYSNDSQRVDSISGMVREANMLLNSNEISAEEKKALLFSLGDFSNSKRIDANNLHEDDFYKKTIDLNTIEDGTSLNYGQKQFIDEFTTKRHSSFSMPTSFGKSFLLRIIVKKMVSRGMKIVIIVPTISLMNEYVNALKDFNPKTRYHHDSKLLILTQERALQLSFYKVDCAIFDEAYESFNDDLRSVVTSKIIAKAYKENAIIKLISPNLKDPISIIPKPIQEYFTPLTINTTLSSREIIPIPNDNYQTINKIIEENIDKKVIIYEAKTHMLKRALLLEARSKVFIQSKAIDYLEKIYDKNFILLKLIRRGIAIHNADVPKDIRYITELLFKNNKIRILFANMTITQGVNLKAEILIINSKGTKGALTKFMKRNLIGRVGRYANENFKLRHGFVYINNEKRGLKCMEFQDLSNYELLEYEGPTKQNDISKIKASDGTFTIDKPIIEVSKYAVHNINHIKQYIIDHREDVQNLSLNAQAELLWLIYKNLIEKPQVKIDSVEKMYKILSNLHEGLYISAIKMKNYLMQKQADNQVGYSIFKDIYGSKIKYCNLNEQQESILIFAIANKILKERNLIKDNLLIKLNGIIFEYKLIENVDIFNDDKEHEAKIESLGLNESFINQNLPDKDELVEIHNLMKIDC